MILDLEEQDLKKGVLGLVIALVEIIKEALRLQALRRMEAGSLTEREVDRLGESLMDLEAALEKLKLELGVAEAVKSIRDGLDAVVEEAITSLLSPAGGQRQAASWAPGSDSQG